MLQVAIAVFVEINQSFLFTENEVIDTYKSQIVAHNFTFCMCIYYIIH